MLLMFVLFFFICLIPYPISFASSVLQNSMSAQNGLWSEMM